MKRRFAPVVIAAAGLAACADQMPTDSLSITAPGRTPESFEVAPFLPGRLIVRLKPATGGEARSAVESRLSRVLLSAGAYEAETQEAMMLDRTYIVSVTEGEEAEAAAALSGNPEVEVVEPDYLAHVEPCELGTCSPPHTAYWTRKWDLTNRGRIAVPGGSFIATGKEDADIDWIEAYSELGGQHTSGAAIIGIVDSGIRATHRELAPRVIGARNFAAGYPATLTDDRIGHGTHVAGITAARGGAGVHGVAWGGNIKLLNAKACELYRFPDGSVGNSCPSSSIANAIVWAVDNGADVINLSISTAATVPAGPEVQRLALAYARANDVLPICATGNDGGSSIGWPARFSECVAVGATDWADNITGYSNQGAGIDLVAPGGAQSDRWPYSAIFSTYNNSDDGYAYMTGTSMAAPQVTGLAALLYATGLSDDEEVLERMRQTVDDLGATGYDPTFGAGRINVCRAMNPKHAHASMPATFNRKSKGTYTVVLYGEAAGGGHGHAVGGMVGAFNHNGEPEPAPSGFDPAKLGEASITLGDGQGGEAHVELKGDAFRMELLDVDLDGDLDLQLKFDREALAEAVAPGTTVLYVRGTIGCRRVEAHQDVAVLN